jgi:hypothetical protein
MLEASRPPRSPISLYGARLPRPTKIAASTLCVATTAMMTKRENYRDATIVAESGNL